MAPAKGVVSYIEPDVDTPPGTVPEHAKIFSEPGFYVYVEVMGFKPTTSTMRRSSEPFRSEGAEQHFSEKNWADSQISLWNDDRLVTTKGRSCPLLRAPSGHEE